MEGGEFPRPLRTSASLRLVRATSAKHITEEDSHVGRPGGEKEAADVSV